MAELAPRPKLAPDSRELTPDEKLGLSGISAATGPSKIEQAFGHLTPPGMNEADRAKFIAGIAVAVYIEGLEPEKLRERLEQTRATVAKERGDADPQVDRLAGLRFAREIRKEAAAHDPLDNLENASDARKYGAAKRVAIKELDWSPEDFRKATIDMIVQHDGDKSKAIDSLVEFIKRDRPFSLKNTVDVTAPEMDSHEKRLTGRDMAEKGVSQGFQVEAAGSESGADPERDAVVARRMAGVDKIAAVVLSDKEYAAYRLTRDNAHLVHLDRRDMTLDGSQTDNTPGKLVAQELNISMRAGRQYVVTFEEKLRDAAGGLDRSVTSPAEAGLDVAKRAQARLTTPTEDLVKAVRTDRSAEAIQASRDRERAATRERAARLYAKKKAQQQEMGR
jgi:hypothetical protein